MESFLYLATLGRNSGLWRRLEVWFVEVSGSFYLLAEAHEPPDWLQNIEANSQVRFSIGTRRDETRALQQVEGRGRVLNELEDTELCARIRASMYAKYRWRSGTIVELVVTS